jgi:hypothetical protein
MGLFRPVAGQLFFICSFTKARRISTVRWGDEIFDRIIVDEEPLQSHHLTQVKKATEITHEKGKTGSFIKCSSALHQSLLDS